MSATATDSDFPRNLKIVLLFIQRHRDLILATNPYNLSLLFNIHQTGGDVEKESSCFWIPAFLCDLLRLKPHHLGREIDIRDMSPGHYYYLSLVDHDTSIIYVDDENIFCVDYYMETGRKNFFWARRFTRVRLDRFIKAALDIDINNYAAFHQGNQAYRTELRKSVQWSIGYYGFAKLVEHVYEQPLSHIPTLQDIRRVVTMTDPSFPYTDVETAQGEFGSEDVYDFELEPPEALEYAREIYENKLTELLELIPE